ncbi:hypothetical protein D3C83_30640 [compost metagenome]
MRVHDRLHFRARPVDAGVQVEFQRRLAAALDHVAVEVDRADVVDREQAALARADVDEHAALAGADAGVAVVVDDVRPLQHADAVDQLLLQRIGFRHDLFLSIDRDK